MLCCAICTWKALEGKISNEWDFEVVKASSTLIIKFSSILLREKSNNKICVKLGNKVELVHNKDDGTEQFTN